MHVPVPRVDHAQQVAAGAVLQDEEQVVVVLERPAQVHDEVAGATGLQRLGLRQHEPRLPLALDVRLEHHLERKVHAVASPPRHQHVREGALAEDLPEAVVPRPAHLEKTTMARPGPLRTSHRTDARLLPQRLRASPS